MRTALKLPLRIAAFVMLAGMLCACRPKPPETPPAPSPPPPEVVARAEAPAPAEPAASAAPATGAASSEPAIAVMSLATVSSKLGVPVDLRYQFSGEVEDSRPVTLYLAAVPRVAGSNLVVSIKQEPGVEASGGLNVEKASATAAYRQQLSVTRHAGGPAGLRVLVMMDLPEGSAFGYYTVPFKPSAVTVPKSERVEQR